MSQKKHKKRRPQGAKKAENQAAESRFSSDTKNKRMVPLARNMLLLALVILAGGEFLRRQEMITPLVSDGIGLGGLILTLLALWVQFGGRGRPRSGGERPRLK